MRADPHKRWPMSPWPSRDAELLAHAAAGLSHTEIGYRMGLGSGAVGGRLTRLREVGITPQRPTPHPKTPKPSAYTPEQNEQIDRLRRAGMVWAEIAVALGYHPTHGAAIRRHAQAAKLATRPDPLSEPERDLRKEADCDLLPKYHPLSWGMLAEFTPSIAEMMAAYVPVDVTWWGTEKRRG